METIGSASAATLGYIVGNLPGAYYGYKAYKMAPIRYGKRRRSSTMSSRKKFRGLPKFRVSGKRSNYNVTTTQKDYSTQYRKKNMPRYKKKAWKTFNNKVKSVIRGELGLKTVVFNSVQTCSSAVADQNAIAMHLYGISGSADNPNRIGALDVRKIFSNDPNVYQGIGPLNPEIGKLLFESAVLDVTLTNTGESVLEVDIYYGYHRKDCDSTDMVGGDLVDPTLELPINGGNTTLDIQKRGVTVFDLPTGLSQSGYHVLKKQKMLLRQTQSAFLQYRDPRNHTVEWNRIKQVGYAARKLTYTVLVVFKAVAGSTDAAVLSIGATRKFSYNANVKTTDESALNP